MIPDPGAAKRQLDIHPATSTITLANRCDHFLARWGVKRSEHRVEPGLYALGNPTADSPVFVTANYTLSFDALRSALAGINSYIMVRDRLLLIPVELVHGLLPMLAAAVVSYFIGGSLAAIGAITAILAGVVLFPILLPWLPARDFSTKGFILGGAAALPFVLAIFLGKPEAAWWLKTGQALIYLLAVPACTAYLAHPVALRVNKVVVAGCCSRVII